MVKVIIVDKSGNLKCTDVKQFDVGSLYKKCNLRKSDNFEKRATWKMNDDYYVNLFSKDKGKENRERKKEKKKRKEKRKRSPITHIFGR